MKVIRGILSVLVCAAIFCIPAAAANSRVYNDSDNDFKIEVPEDFTLLTQSNLSHNSDFINSIGYSVSSFRKAMTDSNVVMCAAAPDNSVQVLVRCWEDNTSKTVTDLAKLDDEQRQTAAATIRSTLGKNVTVTSAAILSGENSVFLRYVTKADGFGCVHYITIVNSKFYSLVYYNDESEITDEQAAQADKLFENFEVNKKGENYVLYVIYRIGGFLIILAAIVLIVFLVYTLVRDLLRQKEKPEIIPEYIKMNRKRKK